MVLEEMIQHTGYRDVVGVVWKNFVGKFDEGRWISSKEVSESMRGRR